MGSTPVEPVHRTGSTLCTVLLLSCKAIVNQQEDGTFGGYVVNVAAHQLLRMAGISIDLRTRRDDVVEF